MKLTAGISYKRAKEFYEKEKDGRVKQRLFIVLKAYKLKSSYKIAALADTSHTKVQRWIKRFNKFGLEGLKDKPRSGKPSKLSEQEKKELQSVIDNHGDFRAGFNSIEILDKIKNLFGKNYTLRHVRRLLHRLGYSKIKPRPYHIKKDPIKAKSVIKKLKKNSYVWAKNGQLLQEMNSA